VPAAGRPGGVLGDTCVSRNGLGNHIRGIVGTGIEARHSPERAGVRGSLADLTRAADLLGYPPAVAFREGAGRTVEGLRGSGEPAMGTRQ
jgi:UDP-glucose 4-epimerase